MLHRKLSLEGKKLGNSACQTPQGSQLAQRGLPHAQTSPSPSCFFLCFATCQLPWGHAGCLEVPAGNPDQFSQPEARPPAPFTDHRWEGVGRSEGALPRGEEVQGSG